MNMQREIKVTTCVELPGMVGKDKDEKKKENIFHLQPESRVQRKREGEITIIRTLITWTTFAVFKLKKFVHFFEELSFNNFPK